MGEEDQTDLIIIIIIMVLVVTKVLEVVIKVSEVVTQVLVVKSLVDVVIGVELPKVRHTVVRTPTRLHHYHLRSLDSVHPCVHHAHLPGTSVVLPRLALTTAAAQGWTSAALTPVFRSMCASHL